MISHAHVGTGTSHAYVYPQKRPGPGRWFHRVAQHTSRTERNDPGGPRVVRRRHEGRPGTHRETTARPQAPQIPAAYGR
jgi:hypothetical protein